MAQVEFDRFGAQAARTGGFAEMRRQVQGVLSLGAAATSAALIVGLGFWGYDIAVRDVSGVPVVRALEGAMRIAPVDPGGDVAAHQGLAVNVVAALGVAQAPAERLVLAPRGSELRDDDAAGLAPPMQVGTATPVLGAMSIGGTAADVSASDGPLSDGVRPADDLLVGLVGGNAEGPVWHRPPVAVIAGAVPDAASVDQSRGATTGQDDASAVAAAPDAKAVPQGQVPSATASPAATLSATGDDTAVVTAALTDPAEARVLSAPVKEAAPAADDLVWAGASGDPMGFVLPVEDFTLPTIVTADPPAPEVGRDSITPTALAGIDPDAVNRAMAEALAEVAIPRASLAESVPTLVSAGVVRSVRPQARPAGVASQPVAAAAVDDPAPDTTEVAVETLATGTYLVQVGAFDDAGAARGEWTRLAGRFGDLLTGKARVVQAAQSGGRTFFRLRATGFEGADDARRFCSALRAEGADCIPVELR